MHFIVVSNEEIAPLARKLTHGISMLPEHSASFWTEKHYKNNESTLGGKQRVVFLGENEISKSYVNILKERFSAYGANCYWEGAKALLTAQPPDSIDNSDISSFKRIVKNKRDEIAKSEMDNKSAGGNIMSKGWILLLFPFGIFATLGGGIGYLVSRYILNKQRQKTYNQLQLEYVLMRFFDEEFCKFIEDTGNK